MTENAETKKYSKLKQELAMLRSESSKYTRIIADLQYIKKIINEELKQPEYKIWIEQGLVRKDESFDDWYNRFFIRTKGYKKGNWDDSYAKRLYNNGGIQVFDRHIEQLFVLKDARLKDSMLYEKYKDKYKIKDFNINLSELKKEDIQKEINKDKIEQRIILNKIKRLMDRKNSCLQK